MHRRRFLETVAAMPLIFGLDEILGGCRRDRQTGDPPEFWRQALDRMKKTNRPGIVLVAPRGEKDRRTFGERLWWMLKFREDEDQEVIGSAILDGRAAEIAPLQVRTLDLFLESVVVALAPELARPCLGQDVRTAVTDSDGHVLATSSVAAAIVSTGWGNSCRTFPPAEELRTLLHGPDLSRLRGFAATCRAALGDQERIVVEDALRTVRDADEEPGPATEILRAAADRIAPWLVAEKLTSLNPRTRRRLHEVIQSLAPPAAARLPFGTHLDRAEEPFPHRACPTCGLMRTTTYTRTFLTFLTR